ncbi:MAG: anti-sigma factor [Anaerolineaceae bacterium]
MADAHVLDDLPGFALGMLEAEDSARVAAHVANCELCKKELAAFEATSAQIAAGALVHSAVAPDPGLKAKVIRRVSQSSAQRVREGSSVAPRADAPLFGLLEAIQNIFRSPAGVVLGLVTVLALVMLGISNFRLSQQVQEYETAESARYMQVVRLKGTDAAPGANGYVMVFKEQQYGSLAVTHAPVLDAGHVYQIWLHLDGEIIDGGTFGVNADGYGNLMVSADRPLGDYDSFGITIEPTGGSKQPTGEKVLGSE